MKKILSFLPALALLILACANAAFSSGTNTAVTLSYLNGTYRRQLTEELSGALAPLDGAYQSALDELAGKTGQGSAGWAVTDTFRALYPGPGETVTLSAGSGLMWYTGLGTADAPLIDVTAGAELPAGASLQAGHRYLTDAGATVFAGSYSSCGAQGAWRTTATGSAPPQPLVIHSVGLDPADKGTARANTAAVTVGSTPVTFMMYALGDMETNYIKLRDLADVLNGTAAQFNVGWNGSILLETGKPYTDRDGTEHNAPYSGDQHYRKNAASIYIDGLPVELTAFTLNDGGSTYFKLRDLGQALGFNVGWTSETGVYLEPDAPYDPNN